MARLRALLAPVQETARAVEEHARIVGHKGASPEEYALFRAAWRTLPVDPLAARLADWIDTLSPEVPGRADRIRDVGRRRGCTLDMLLVALGTWQGLESMPADLREALDLAAAMPPERALSARAPSRHATETPPQMVDLPPGQAE